MPKRQGHYSSYAKNAAALLGQLIRMARIERRMTADELAERLGVSRGLVHRIERGEPGCSVGAVFEAAAIVGVPLFGAEDPSLMASASASVESRLRLLPKAARQTSRGVKDDF